MTVGTFSSTSATVTGHFVQETTPTDSSSAITDTTDSTSQISVGGVPTDSHAGTVTQFQETSTDIITASSQQSTESFSDSSGVTVPSTLSGSETFTSSVSGLSEFSTSSSLGGLSSSGTAGTSSSDSWTSTSESQNSFGSGLESSTTTNGPLGSSGVSSPVTGTSEASSESGSINFSGGASTTGDSYSTVDYASSSLSSNYPSTVYGTGGKK